MGRWRTTSCGSRLLLATGIGELEEESWEYIVGNSSKERKFFQATQPPQGLCGHILTALAVANNAARAFSRLSAVVVGGLANGEEKTVTWSQVEDKVQVRRITVSRISASC